MENKLFWRKFKELADVEKARREKLDYGFFDGLEMKEIVQVVWVQFKEEEDLTKEEQDLKTNKLTALFKEKNLLAVIDFDDSGAFGSFDYDAKLLQEIDKIMGIEQISFEIAFVQKK